MASLNRALRALIFRLRGGLARRPPNTVVQTGLNHARDLDAPFGDPKAQERAAQVIAEKGAKKAPWKK